MGWQDDPIITDAPSPSDTPSPQEAPSGWRGDPVVEPSALESPSMQPEPSMGSVAMNAVPKGFANLLNTPVTLSNLIMQGIASLPGAGHLTSLQDAAANPELKQNAPMDAMRSAGLVKPENEPQTGPQHIVDMAIQTAIGSAVVPGGGAVGAFKGAAMGAISGAAAQTTKELTGSDFLAAAVGMATPLVMTSLAKSSPTVLLNAKETMTFKEARAEGFVVEPSRVRAPSELKETVAGVAAIAQNAAIKNQAVADTLTEKFLSVPPQTPLDKPLLKALRDKAAEPYRQVASLSPDAATALEELKQVRADARAAYRSYDANANPAFLAEAKKLSTSADTWEKVIEDIAQQAGRPELIPQLRGAREYIARTYAVQDVLNVGSGHVSLPKIGKMLQDGAPLTGEFALMGRFARSFQRVAREIESIPPAGVSGTDAASASMLAVGGAGAAGNVVGMAAGGLPLLRGPAREKVLSKAYQDNLIKGSGAPMTRSKTAALAGVAGLIFQGNRAQSESAESSPPSPSSDTRLPDQY